MRPQRIVRGRGLCLCHPLVCRLGRSTRRSERQPVRPDAVACSRCRRACRAAPTRPTRVETRAARRITAATCRLRGPTRSRRRRGRRPPQSPPPTRLRIRVRARRPAEARSRFAEEPLHWWTNLQLLPVPVCERIAELIL